MSHISDTDHDCAGIGFCKHPSHVIPKHIDTYYGWDIIGQSGEWYASYWTPGGSRMLRACPCRTLADVRRAIRENRAS